MPSTYWVTGAETPLSYRWKPGEVLAEALAKVEYPVLRSTPFHAKPSDLIRAAKELQLEGYIAKRKDSLYEPGRRSGAWVKFKINQSQEFVIGGYTPGNPFDALIVGCYEAGKLNYVAKLRAGFVPRVRREFSSALEVWKRKGVPLRICRRSAGRGGP
jgi:ATP-dependent DNA ligase